jgi:hypothetical protein
MSDDKKPSPAPRRAISPEELNIRFDYHPPKTGQPEQYAQVRQRIKELAAFLNNELPEGREKHVVFTQLEQVSFYANASIARRS